MASNIPVIVQGNSFSLAIPLQIYVIQDGEMVLQNYTPDPTDEVSVQLKGSRRNYTYTPTIDGNVTNIDLSGNELADNYSVVVSIVKANGQRLRSFRTDQFFIVESSDDLTTDDIIQGLEENVIYLNTQCFVAGADGRGIASIVKTSTSGLVDTYTIYYSDNTTSTFTVTNGAQGEAGATIASVEKTSTAGLVDTYTITMTDGATFNFEVTNGLDGVDLGATNIVDDLVTGGSTNVLSAEQGKVLNNTKVGLEETTKETELCLGQMVFYQQNSVSFYRCYAVCLDTIRVGMKFKAEDVPSGFSVGISTRQTYADAMSAISLVGVEDTTWKSGTAELTISNSNSKYLVIAFKHANNNTKLTDNEIKTLYGAVKVTVYEDSIYLKHGDIQTLPKSDASQISYGESNLKDAMDNLQQRIAWSDVVYIQSGSSVIRIAYLYKIPKGMIDISCDITLPSGIRFATKTIPDIATAYENLFVRAADVAFDSKWITRGKYHATIYNSNHEVLALVFSKGTGGTDVDQRDVVEVARKFVVKSIIPLTCDTLTCKPALKIAHRGTHYFNIPENSLDAFDFASKLGYDFIECDVRATSDSKYVIMHDTSINRTCVNADNTAISGTVNVASTAYSTLRTNYVLKSSNPDYRKPIPSLEEYLYTIKNNGAIAMIELEQLTNAQVKDIYDMAKEIMGDGNFVFNSSFYGELDYVRTIDEHVLLFYETYTIIDTTNTVDGRSRNASNNIWYPDYSGSYGTVDAATVKAYHAKGMKVAVWTVPAEDYNNVINLGVDYIATNDIAPNVHNANAMTQVFDRNNRHSNYVTDGTIGTDGVTLTNGQTFIMDSISFERGMLLVEVEGSGDFTITTNTKKLISSARGDVYSDINKAVSSETLCRTLISGLYMCDNIALNSDFQITLTITASTNGAFIQSIKIYNVKI